MLVKNDVSSKTADTRGSRGSTAQNGQTISETANRYRDHNSTKSDFIRQGYIIQVANAFYSLKY